MGRRGLIYLEIPKELWFLEEPFLHTRGHGHTDNLEAEQTIAAG